MHPCMQRASLLGTLDCVFNGWCYGKMQPSISEYTYCSVMLEHHLGTYLDGGINQYGVAIPDQGPDPIQWFCSLWEMHLAAWGYTESQTACDTRIKVGGRHHPSCRFSKDRSICTKHQISHYHTMSKSAGVLQLKQNSCSGSTCNVYKVGSIAGSYYQNSRSL